MSEPLNPVDVENTPSRERDVLPTPDAGNLAHNDFVWNWLGCLTDEQIGDGEEERVDSIRGHVLRLIDRLEAAQSSKASVDALVEKAARVIHDSDELFPPKEWGARSEALRNNYRANARALLAAGLLTNPERSTES